MEGNLCPAVPACTSSANRRASLRYSEEQLQTNFCVSNILWNKMVMQAVQKAQAASLALRQAKKMEQLGKGC